MQWFCLDLETSNSDKDIIDNSTRVWLWDIYEPYLNEHYNGSNIKSLVEFILNGESCIYYIHNLKFDASFIINYLLTHGFTINDTRETNTITTLVSDRLVWYKFTVYYGKKKFEFRDSLKKIVGSLKNAAKAFNLSIEKGEIDYTKYRPKGYLYTQEELNYVHIDTEIMGKILMQYYEQGMNSLTNASDALKEYKKIIGKNEFKKFFPILDISIDNFIRKSYKGGYCYVNPKFKNKDLNKIYTYDVKSMYPSIMYEKPLPFDIPVHYNGKYEYDPFMPLYIQRILVDCKIKENHIPAIQTKTFLSVRINYLYDTKGKQIEMYLTNIDLKLLYEHYDIYEIEYIEGYKFRCKNDLFKEYIGKYYKLKETTKGAKKQLYKVFLNSLYGKFAMSPIKGSAIPKIENNKIIFDKFVDEEGEPIYTAVASFITSYAREKLLTAIQVNFENFVYCDTDSIHLIKPAHNIRYGFNLGDFAIENGTGTCENDVKTDIIKGRYLGQKCYMLQKENGILKKIAGATESIKEYITFDNFHYGLSTENVYKQFPKYRMKQVKNGMLLIPTKFQIKEK